MSVWRNVWRSSSWLQQVKEKSDGKTLTEPGQDDYFPGMAILMWPIEKLVYFIIFFRIGMPIQNRVPSPESNNHETFKYVSSLGKGTTFSYWKVQLNNNNNKNKLFKSWYIPRSIRNAMQKCILILLLFIILTTLFIWPATDPLF